MFPQIELSESNKEALAIRWRRLLTIGLIDFFNGTNDFGKLVVKELLDMHEGLIKALAESLHIPLFTSDAKWRSFQTILRDILNHQNLTAELEAGLREVNATLSSEEFNSPRRLRNDETHYLNLPDIPKETVRRVWRLFYKLANLVDMGLCDYAKNRPELEDFYFLQDFFRKVVLEGNRERIDLNKIKMKTANYPYIKVDRKLRTAEVDVEKSTWELIKSVSKGEYV